MIKLDQIDYVIQLVIYIKLIRNWLLLIILVILSIVPYWYYNFYIYVIFFFFFLSILIQWAYVNNKIDIYVSSPLILVNKMLSYDITRIGIA